MKSSVFVFDMDGVLVDTLTPLFLSYLDFLKSFGHKGSAKEFDRLNGPSIPEIVKYLKNKYGLEPDEKQLLGLYLERVDQIYLHAPLNKNAKEILSFLKKQGFPLALASSASKKNIHTILKRYNLESFFDLVVSGDDVNIAKPAPDIYLAVKTALGDENQYHVIEDSGNGLAAASSAGMETIFYQPEKTTKSPLKGAKTVISDLIDLRLISLRIFSGCNVLKIKSGCSLVQVVSSTNRASTSNEKTDQIWKEQTQKKPNLFNGQIAAFHSIKTDQDGHMNIQWFVTDYKTVFAQHSEKKISNPITPLCVSGIIIDEKKQVLMGKRNQSVTQYQNCYELIPSGGLPADIAKKNGWIDQLIEEFEEETGMDKSQIYSIAPIALITDPLEPVCDICLKIYITGFIEEKKLSCPEHDKIKIIHIDRLIHAMQKVHPAVPTSRAIAFLAGSEAGY